MTTQEGSVLQKNLPIFMGQYTYSVILSSSVSRVQELVRRLQNHTLMVQRC